MPVNILMPALSPTMEKGNLAKWLKKEGDKVQPGDVIAEIETDKATMEYEAIDEGTLAKIVVPEGTQDVPVNQLIAVLAEEGEDVKAAAAAAAGKGPSPKPAAAAPKSAGAATASPQRGEGTPPSQLPPTRSTSSQGEEVGARNAAGEGARTERANRIFSSPLARRLAKDAGIRRRTTRSARCSSRAPTTSSRTTTCAG